MPERLGRQALLESKRAQKSDARAGSEPGRSRRLVAGAHFASDEKTRPRRLERKVRFNLPVKPDSRHREGLARQHRAALAAVSRR
jgi:hypothetical protein